MNMDIPVGVLVSMKENEDGTTTVYTDVVNAMQKKTILPGIKVIAVLPLPSD